MTPAAVALAAGVGIDHLEVRRRPLVGILATGDEVRSAGQELGPAGIPDANGPGLVALSEAAGADPRVLGVAKDRLEDVKARICAGLVEGADILIVSGGVSVGPYDVVRAGFEAYGSVDLWRVAVQPGKPFAFGTALRSDGRPTLLFGLPGNPVSTFVTFELFVRPAIRRLLGSADALRPSDDAVLVEATSKSEGRRAYLRVVAERAADGRPARDGEGRVRVRLAGGQGSHVLSALAAADGLAIVPEALADVPAGTPVGLWWLDR
jgi:molybdenum cofactor synthesis domain-containing protein